MEAKGTSLKVPLLTVENNIKHVSIPLFDRSWLLDVQLWWTTWEFKDIRSTWQSAWLLPAKLTVAYTKSVPLKRWWHKVYILKWSSLCPTLHYVKLNPCCAKEVIIFLAKHWLIHHFTSLKRQNMLARKGAPNTRSSLWWQFHQNASPNLMKHQ